MLDGREFVRAASSEGFSGGKGLGRGTSCGWEDRISRVLTVRGFSILSTTTYTNAHTHIYGIERTYAVDDASIQVCIALALCVLSFGLANAPR